MEHPQLILFQHLTNPVKLTFIALGVHIIDGGHRHFTERLARGFFDGPEQVALARGDKQDRLAGAPGAAGPANAVHVGLGVVGNVVVDHVRDALHIEPASGNVGGHQQVNFSSLERLDQLLALVLGHIAVEGLGREPASAQAVRQLFGGDFGSGKHNHGIERLNFQQAR